MAFIKEESEDMKIEETFSLKQEDADEQTKMAFIKEESEDMKIEVFRVKHEYTETQTGAKPGTEQTCKARGQTTKDCYKCRKKIGVASKTCQHCSAKQPYKQKLETKKNQLSQEWKDRQKKNSSVNKVYDATNLLLHKWELLERYPVLLLARRTSNGFSAECLCPWKMDTEDTQDAFLTIKRLYESLLNVANTDKEASSMGESSATNSTRTETSPAESTADPASESTPLLTSNVANTDKEASSMGESSATNSTRTEISPADPTPLLTPESDTLLLPPASSSLASPVSFTTSLTSPMSLTIAPPVSPLTHPVFISSQSSPISSSLASPLPPAPSLSTCSTLSTEQGSPGPVSSSRKKRQIKRKADPKECPMHKESTSFPYKNILGKRIKEGHAEVLVQWHPCSGCGKKWENSWEPRENIQSSS